MENSGQTLKAVIFFDRGWWVAQCLDYDVCVSAKSRERLPRKLLRRLQSRAGFDLSRGLSPFQNTSKAPDKFWTMYAAASPFEVQELREPWFVRLWSIRQRAPRLRAELAFGLASFIPIQHKLHNQMLAIQLAADVFLNGWRQYAPAVIAPPQNGDRPGLRIL